ncbi:hypothetical protein C8R47DRAFT_1328068 [Mycena vitilis]|nr:hypothetical protein C8R47DRAFT_1328068 [Mycena vitilis]
MPGPPSLPEDLPEDLSAFQLAVERAAKLHEKASYRSSARRLRRILPGLSVKYTDHVTMKPECAALHVLYTLACNDGDAAPHVPRPIHYFHQLDGWHWGFMVMERVAVREVPCEELCVKTAEAVKWMRAQRPPPMTVFGSLGGRYARHNIFPDTHTPLRFKSVASGTLTPSQVISHIRRPWSPIPEVSLTGDGIVFTQPDMDASKFGALPLTLADFTLLRTTQFAKDVAAHMFPEDEITARRGEPNMMSPGEVRRRVSMCADPSYNLDEDGNAKPGGRRGKRPAAEPPVLHTSPAIDG